MRDLQLSLQKLPEDVRCIFRYGCNTMRCSCKKHVFICSLASLDCKGVCANIESLPDETDSASDYDSQ